MKLSAVKILELNEEYSLVENLSDREINNPEGSGIDLRVGQVHRLESESFLGADETTGERFSSKISTVGDLETDEHKNIVMKPGEYFLVTTLETINSPNEKIKYNENLPEAYIIPKVWARSSLHRGGVSFHATKISLSN